nr:uncharacterized protein LOC129385908 [Dermacentor andersoni]
MQHVLECAAAIARKVFWFAIPPRLNEGENGKKRMRVNAITRQHVAAMTNVICLNLEDRFLGKARAMKPAFYGADGYHVSRGAGIKALARALSLAVRAAFRAEWQPCGRKTATQNWKILYCAACQAKGHVSPQCETFLQNAQP